MGKPGIYNETLDTEKATQLFDAADCGLLRLVYKNTLKEYYANPYFYQLLGYTPEEYKAFFHTDPNARTHPEDKHRIRAMMDKQRGMGGSIRFEARALKKDNSIIWLHCSITPVYKNGSVIYICVLYDITTSKISIANLNRSKNEFDLLANNMPGGLLKFNAKDYSILYANDGFFRLTGLTRTKYAALYKNKCISAVYPEDKKLIKSTIDMSLKAKKPFSLEYRIMDENNEVRWSYVNGAPVWEDPSSDPYIFCIIMDITEHKNYQSSIELWEQRALNIIRLIGENLWEYDIKTDSIFRHGDLSTTYSAKSQIEHYLEFIKEESVIHPDDQMEFQSFYNQLLAGHDLMHINIRMRNHLGIYTWTKLQGITLTDENGTALKIIGNSQGIDETVGYEDTVTLLDGLDEMAIISEYIQELSEHSACGMMLLRLNNYDSLEQLYGTGFCNAVISDGKQRIQEAFMQVIITQPEPSTCLLFFPQVEDEENFLHDAAYIQTLFSEIYTGSIKSMISVSIGMAVCRDKTTPADMLQKEADIALSNALNHAEDKLDIYGYSRQLTAMETAVPDTGVSYFTEPAPQFYPVSLASRLLSLRNPKQLELSVNNTLSEICRHFQANEAVIVESRPADSKSIISYSFRTPDCPAQLETLSELPFHAVESYSLVFEKGPIFYYEANGENASLLENAAPFIYNGIRSCGIKTMLQFGFYENNEYFGHLSLNYYFKAPEFTEDEKSAFYLTGKILNSVISSRRITEENSGKRLLDALTGLPTFNTFIRDANALLNQNITDHYALVYTDINKFKTYNITYGFTIGNKIIQSFGNTIQKALHSDETAARIEKDHFVMLLKYRTQQGLITRLNQTIQGEQNQIFEDYYRFESVCGIYMIPDSQRNITDITDMLDKADMARRSVKGFSGSHYAFYSESMSEENDKMDTMKQKLETALKNREFVPYLQPQYRMTNGDLVSAEVLTRLIQRSGDVMLPKDFLPVMEENGMTAEMDFQIIGSVCQSLRQLLDAKMQIHPFCFNLSPIHLNTPSFTEKLLRIVEKHRIPVGYIWLEITEKIFIQYPEQVKFLLRELHTIGFQVIVDDFGETYSSLNLMRDFEIDAIKIDTRFISTRIHHAKDRVILTKIIETAKELGLTVFAEDVENPLHERFLKEAGCDIVQGTYYSNTMPIDVYVKRVLK